MPARLWTGTTEAGTPVHAFIVSVSARTQDPAQLADFDEELELIGSAPDEPTRTIDPRFVL